MEKFGDFLGWVAAICYFVSVGNFFVKWIFRKWLAKLPKDSAVKTTYQAFMKLIVKYHRYFGMAAGAIGAVHLCWQIQNVRLSYSGALVCALMAVTAIIGIVIAYGKKRELVKAHRPLALALLAVILFHMITKI